MDILNAFVRGFFANQDRPLMVFDWNKAAKIIKKEKPVSASAGLRDDWEWTGGLIYKDGHPIMNGHTYLASVWTVPELELDGKVISCFTKKNPHNWDCDTKWPESALKILDEE